jgi:hypothetical protein
MAGEEDLDRDRQAAAVFAFPLAKPLGGSGAAGCRVPLPGDLDAASLPKHLGKYQVVQRLGLDESPVPVEQQGIMTGPMSRSAH